MDVPLSCACGAVQGVALDITPSSGSRVVCCCDDCQKFAAQLHPNADILDEFGGTEIFQISQSQVRIESGIEHVRCLRLTSKGLYRWYTNCCNTPIGNSFNSRYPFFGVIHNFMRIENDREAVLGKIRAYVQTKFAIGTPNYPHASEKFPVGITLRIIRKILIWKLKGMNKPSAFFNDNGRAIIKPIVVSDASAQ